jgi:hypothetical protein
LKATNEDRGAAALQAIKLDDDVDGRAIQIRVTQGKEPPHFIAMYVTKTEIPLPFTCVTSIFYPNVGLVVK